MSYTQGGKIEGTDYNSFLSRVNEVYGIGSGDFGYGQTITTQPPGFVSTSQLVGNDSSIDAGLPVSAGDPIYADHWEFLFRRIEQIGVHQGTPIFLPNIFDIVTHLNDLDTSVTLIEDNRLLVNPSWLSVNTIPVAVNDATSWTGAAYVDFEFNFASVDAARHFFNIGGGVNLDFTLGPGGGAIDLEWRNFLDSIGRVFIDSRKSNSVLRPNANGPGFGNLTSSLTTLYTVAPAGGGYTSISFTLQGSFVGSTLTLRAIFDTDTENVVATLNWVVSKTRPTGSTVAGGLPTIHDVPTPTVTPSPEF